MVGFSLKLFSELKTQMLASRSVELQAHGFTLSLRQGEILCARSDMDKIWLVRRLFSMGWIQHQNRDFFLNNPIEPRFFPKLTKEVWDEVWPKILKERSEQNLFELLCLAQDWTWFSLENEPQGSDISLMDQEMLDLLSSYWQKKDVYTILCVNEKKVPEWLSALIHEDVFLDEILLDAPFEGVETILHLLDLEKKGAIRMFIEQDDNKNTELFFSEEAEDIIPVVLNLQGEFVEISTLYQEVYDCLEEQDLKPQQWLIKILSGLQDGSRLKSASFDKTPDLWIASLIEVYSDEKLLLQDLSRFFARLLKGRPLVSHRAQLNSKHQAWKHQWKL